MSSRDLFDLSGRVAMVTGGAGLLGAAFVEALAAAGGRIVVADLDGESARSVASRVAATFGVEAFGAPLDVADKTSVQRVVGEAVDRLGRIDILVNSAALTGRGGGAQFAAYFAPVEDYPQEAWDRAVAVNLTGPFLCAQSVGPLMARQGGGSIINISSIYGVVGPDQRIYAGTRNPYRPERPMNTPAPYAATKGGLIALTRYLATYWAGQNVRVNALVPGGVQENHDETFVRNYSARTVLGRMANVDDYKGAIVFLASEASRYMTGTVLMVDGGWTAW